METEQESLSYKSCFQQLFWCHVNDSFDEIIMWRGTSLDTLSCVTSVDSRHAPSVEFLGKNLEGFFKKAQNIDDEIQGGSRGTFSKDFHLMCQSPNTVLQGLIHGSHRI